MATARNLVDSMNNEVIVKDNSIRALIPLDLISYDDSVRLALNERAAQDQERSAGPAADPGRGAPHPDPDTTAR